MLGKYKESTLKKLYPSDPVYSCKAGLYNLYYCFAEDSTHVYHKQKMFLDFFLVYYCTFTGSSACLIPPQTWSILQQHCIDTLNTIFYVMHECTRLFGRESGLICTYHSSGAAAKPQSPREKVVLWTCWSGKFLACVSFSIYSIYEHMWKCKGGRLDWGGTLTGNVFDSSNYCKIFMCITFQWNGINL